MVLSTPPTHTHLQSGVSPTLHSRAPGGLVGRGKTAGGPKMQVGKNGSLGSGKQRGNQGEKDIASPPHRDNQPKRMKINMKSARQGSQRDRGFTPTKP